jgi:hypothetical protein
MGQRYRVVRSIPAGEGRIPAGTIVIDPPWRNREALIGLGRLERLDDEEPEAGGTGTPAGPRPRGGRPGK